MLPSTRMMMATAGTSRRLALARFPLLSDPIFLPLFHPPVYVPSCVWGKAND